MVAATMASSHGGYLLSFPATKRPHMTYTNNRTHTYMLLFARRTQPPTWWHTAVTVAQMAVTATLTAAVGQPTIVAVDGFGRRSKDGGKLSLETAATTMYHQRVSAGHPLPWWPRVAIRWWLSAETTSWVGAQSWPR